MKELLSTIVRPLVNDPDAISIKQVDRGHTIVLELHVAPDRYGKNHRQARPPRPGHPGDCQSSCRPLGQACDC